MSSAELESATLRLGKIERGKEREKNNSSELTSMFIIKVFYPNIIILQICNKLY